MEKPSQGTEAYASKRLSSASKSNANRTETLSAPGVYDTESDPDPECNAAPGPETKNAISNQPQTHESQHCRTVGTTGESYPPNRSSPEIYVVEFDGPDDPTHPLNWPLRVRAAMTAILAFTTFVTTFASGIYAPAIPTIAQKYGVSEEVATLGVTLYVLGFSTGPVVWSPLSEAKGRRLPPVLAAAGTTIFHFAVAVSKDIQSILITRFFAGFFGTSPLAVAGAVFVDMYDSNARGIAVTIFTLNVFIGPLFSPFIGGSIVTSHLGWRWTQYISGTLAAGVTVLNYLFVYETYPPIILVGKAAELRRRTKNWAIHAKQEEVEVNLKELVQRNLTRPLHMLVVEPIVLLSLYSAFMYGLLYLFLTAYPRIFQGVHGMRPGVSGLPELGAVIGSIITGAIMIPRQSAYLRKLKASNHVSIPEWRLPEAMVGGVLFAGGLFWMGWSGYQTEVHWIVPTTGGGVTGFGISLVFLQQFNYLIDFYLTYAASALAANTFLRSLFGAVFPLFTPYMFQTLGIQWSLTLLGCFASLLATFPVVLYWKGAQIRQVSKYNPHVCQKTQVKSKREEV